MTTGVRRWSRVAVFALVSGTMAIASGRGDTLTGRWDATVVVNGVEVPFIFEIESKGTAIKGFFFNGERRIPSTGGTFENGALVLRFDQFAARLEASSADGQLTGRYVRGTRAPYPFRAVRSTGAVRTDKSAPSIGGVWTIGTKSAKGESAWRFVVKQSGARVSATILRVDGDTGTLTGGYREGKFVLSHFSGARPLLLEVTAANDGSLRLVQNGRTTLVAVRADDPRARDAGEPTNPALHTTVTDPSEPFRFSFPDLNGRVHANTDPQFTGKVLLVNISGSWCPNCHDEAPFLAGLYRKYKRQGLEVVTLSFEEADQLANPTRLRAFIRQYGIEYTVLLAGEPDQLNEKVPQAVNLNAFPTTFIVGRDGRVRGVHTGFPSPGSGRFYTQAERDITAQVERLLAERVVGTE